MPCSPVRANSARSAGRQFGAGRGRRRRRRGRQAATGWPARHGRDAAAPVRPEDRRRRRQHAAGRRPAAARGGSGFRAAAAPCAAGRSPAAPYSARAPRATARRWQRRASYLEPFQAEAALGASIKAPQCSSPFVTMHSSRGFLVSGSCSRSSWRSCRAGAAAWCPGCFLGSGWSPCEGRAALVCLPSKEVGLLLTNATNSAARRGGAQNQLSSSPWAFVVSYGRSPSSIVRPKRALAIGQTRASVPAGAKGYGLRHKQRISFEKGLPKRGDGAFRAAASIRTCGSASRRDSHAARVQQSSGEARRALLSEPYITS